MRNQKRCKLHGGKTPSALAKAEKVEILQRAEVAAKKFLTQEMREPLPEVNPIRAMGDAITEMRQVKEMLYSALEDREKRMAKSVENLGGSREMVLTDINVVRGVTITPLFQAYLEVCDRIFAYAEKWVRVGIDAQVVKMERAQAELAAKWTFRVLNDKKLDLTREQKQRAREMISKEAQLEEQGQAN